MKSFTVCSTSTFIYLFIYSFFFLIKQVHGLFREICKVVQPLCKEILKKKKKKKQSFSMM